MKYISSSRVFMLLFVSSACVQCFPTTELNDLSSEPSDDENEKSNAIINFQLLNDEERAIYFKLHHSLRPFRKAIKYGKNIPRRIFKKIIAALVIPGTISGLFAGAIISSAIGLKAGAFAGAAGGSLVSGLQSGLFDERIANKSEGRSFQQNKNRVIWLLILAPNHRKRSSRTI